MFCKEIVIDAPCSMGGSSERQSLGLFKNLVQLTHLIEKVVDSSKNCSDLHLAILIFSFKKLLGGAEIFASRLKQLLV